VENVSLTLNENQANGACEFESFIFSYLFFIFSCLWILMYMLNVSGEGPENVDPAKR
jgi:hypothetical protein